MHPLSIFVLTINSVLFWSRYSPPDFYSNVSPHLTQYLELNQDYHSANEEAQHFSLN